MVHRLGPTPELQENRVRQSSSARKDERNPEHPMQYTVLIDDYQIFTAEEQPADKSLRVVFTIHES